MRPKEELISTRELAEIAGVNEATVKYMRMAGKIEAWAMSAGRRGRPTYLFPKSMVSTVLWNYHPEKRPQGRTPSHARVLP